LGETQREVGRDPPGRDGALGAFDGVDVAVGIVVQRHAAQIEQA
jgi:hypothetical protein